MATKKIRKSLNVEQIFCYVTCPECVGSVRMKMRDAVTRKTCPKCNRCTYIFTITPLRGYISIDVQTIGSDETPTEYDIRSEDIEVVEDEDDDGMPMMEE